MNLLFILIANPFTQWYFVRMPTRPDDSEADHNNNHNGRRQRDLHTRKLAGAGQG